jgi:hypothetical protein
MSSGPTTNEYGAQKWFDAYGKLHRDGDLPAVVWSHGTTEWYQHGFQSWWKHGLRHRDGDLPAVVWSDGTKQWWVDGVRQTPEARSQTRRWSPLRAAFVGAVVVKTTVVCARPA